MSIIKRMIKRLLVLGTGSSLLYKTDWYRSLFVDYDHEIYPDNAWYRKHDERNYDLVNLGSSAAKHAFNYDGLEIKAMNWAQQPQTLPEDYNLVRHFHSILRKGATVVITIMPFTSLNKETGVLDAMKYLKNDCHEPIQPCCIKQARRYMQFPILMGKPALKALAKFLLHYRNDKQNGSLAPDSFEQDAKNWVVGWKAQFGIADLDAPLSSQNIDAQAYRKVVMRNLVDFCTERGYRPVLVIPPVSKHLARLFTPKFEERYIYSYIRGIGRKVKLLDYSKNDAFSEDGLYSNALFLNAKGAKLFTRTVLRDLQLL